MYLGCGMPQLSEWEASEWMCVIVVFKEDFWTALMLGLVVFKKIRSSIGVRRDRNIRIHGPRLSC